MSRLLLVSTPEKGHVNPLVGVAQWCRRAGHHVGWLAIPRPSEQIRTLGVEPLGLPEDAEVPEHVTGGEQLARIARDPIALRGWIRRLLLDAVPGQVEPVRRVLRAFRPDAVGLDPMLYQAAIAAHLEAIPWLGISSSLNPITPESIECDHTRTMRALRPEIDALLRRYGLEPNLRICDLLSPHGTTVFTTAEYVGALADVPARTFLVGPSIAPDARGDEVAFGWERLRPGAPLGYVSFGSQISWQPEMFELVAEAAAPLGMQLVLSAGDLEGTPWARRLPEHALAVRYAPQRALLERARLVVTHGGANTVMEALRAGVPLLISPVCNDQPLQAEFVSSARVGARLDLRHAGVEACRAALRSLLQDPSPIRRRVARVSASYRATDGSRAVADRLAALASR
jgi:MGT family glycosyltransferase